MIQKSKRHVRLYRKYRESRAQGYGRLPGKVVPWLTVSGIWLETAGFNIGDQVEISVENNMLTIKNLGSDGDR